MKKMIFSLTVALLAAQPMAVAAWAQASQEQVATTPPPAPAVAAEPADPDANKEICKAQTSTGSRLAKKKVCRTKAEWDEINRIQRQDAEQMQRGDMAIRTPRGN
jgi:Ni/Co efflux regulator RcnB